MKFTVSKTCLLEQSSFFKYRRALAICLRYNAFVMMKNIICN